MSYDVTHRPERITAGPTRLVFRYDTDGSRYLQRRQPAGLPGTDQGATLYPFPGYEVEVERSGASFSVKSGRHMAGDYGLFRASTSQPQGELVYRHGDRLGSASMQSDGQGVALERRGFDAWGKPREGSWADRAGAALGSTISPRGFTGHEHLDAVGGLIHMNGRAYDPNLGRFLSVDPIIQFPSNSQSLNPYSYLMNNPLAGTDPTGYACKETDSVSGCAGEVKEGETTQIRATEVGSRISKQVGTVTNLGGGAIKVSSMSGAFGIVTNVGNGSGGVGASSLSSLGSNRGGGGIGQAPNAVSIGRTLPARTGSFVGQGPGTIGSPTVDVSIAARGFRTRTGAALGFLAEAVPMSEANNEEYLTGFVLLADGWAYTKPIGGGPGNTVVEVNPLRQALMKTYGEAYTRAGAIGHSHFDRNMEFSADDASVATGVALYLANQNSELRYLNRELIRSTVRTYNRSPKPP